MKSISNEIKLVVRDDREWEHVVMAEVLVPEVPNVYGDYWTPKAVKHAAYMFMERGFRLDLEHDQTDYTGAWYVVESFIARQGDPDFIEGSWVVGMRIHDPTVWQAILDGEINGFSYQAMVLFIEGIIYTDDNMVRQGTTSPDPTDGHTHLFAVIVGEDNRPIAGGTSETDGHSHDIITHSVTGEAQGHVHRYTLVYGKEGK